jgi:hypothetical protein
MRKQKYISIKLQSEEKLFETLEVLFEKNILVKDVFSPYPIEKVCKYIRKTKSSIPWIGFVFGMIGAALAFWLQYWIYADAYPLQYGGKPQIPYPTMLPVVFESGILLSAFAMIFTFLIEAKLRPGNFRKVFEKDITDNCFVILIEKNKGYSIDEFNNLLQTEKIKEIIF